MVSVGIGGAYAGTAFAPLKLCCSGVLEINSDYAIYCFLCFPQPCESGAQLLGARRDQEYGADRGCPS